MKVLNLVLLTLGVIFLIASWVFVNQTIQQRTVEESAVASSSCSGLSECEQIRRETRTAQPNYAALLLGSIVAASVLIALSFRRILVVPSLLGLVTFGVSLFLLSRSNSIYEEFRSYVERVCTEYPRDPCYAEANLRFSEMWDFVPYTVGVFAVVTLIMTTILTFRLVRNSRRRTA